MKSYGMEICSIEIKKKKQSRKPEKALIINVAKFPGSDFSRVCSCGSLVKQNVRVK
jgi:hypothetical protein